MIDIGLVHKAELDWISMRNAPLSYWMKDVRLDPPTLCTEYLRDRPACAQCPVAQSTGKPLCEGTPFYTALAAFKRRVHNQPEIFNRNFRWEVDPEITFLQRLRADLERRLSTLMDRP